MPIYTLADFLRKLRTAKQPKWTQETLAERAGVGVSTIRDIERGAVTHPDTDTLRKLATALDVPLAELVGQMDNGTDSTPPPTPKFPMRRAEDAGISLRARDFAEAYDRLPALAQLAIDAILKAFTHKE